tara:strand:- start:6107 stop:6607 length:501 start_codon:yes stop_codon:yes gene_type:complete
MYLSKNFTLKEMTSSNVGIRLGIDNSPTTEGIRKLTILANSLLQPIRNDIGPLRITSAFRNEAINQALGGSVNSQHCRYEAADVQYFKDGKMDNLKIYESIINNCIEFDQLILEFGEGCTEFTDSSNPYWIHLSYKIADNRNQVLVAYKDENNKTKYRKPIEYKSL